MRVFRRGIAIAAAAGFSSLAAVVPAVHGEVATKAQPEASLTFECQRGEKPGSPSFVLSVAGRAATVARPGSGPRPEQKQECSLTDAEWTALEQAVAAARPKELDELYRGGKEGRCSLAYALGGRSADVRSAASNPTWCAFKELFAWIAALGAGEAGRVEPILPVCAGGAKK